MMTYQEFLSYVTNNTCSSFNELNDILKEKHINNIESLTIIEIVEIAMLAQTSNQRYIVYSFFRDNKKMVVSYDIENNTFTKYYADNIASYIVFDGIGNTLEKNF